MLELDLIAHAEWGPAWRLRCNHCEQTWVTRFTASAFNVGTEHYHGRHLADLMKMSYLSSMMMESEALSVHD